MASGGPKVAKFCHVTVHLGTPLGQSVNGPGGVRSYIDNVSHGDEAASLVDCHS